MNHDFLLAWPLQWPCGRVIQKFQHEIWASKREAGRKRIALCAHLSLPASRFDLSILLILNVPKGQRRAVTQKQNMIEIVLKLRAVEAHVVPNLAPALAARVSGCGKAAGAQGCESRHEQKGQELAFHNECLAFLLTITG